MSIQERSSWKPIPIKIESGGKRDLICFEELTDYEVVDLPSFDDTTDEVEKPLSKKQLKKQKRLLEFQAKKRLLDVANETPDSGNDTQNVSKRRKLDANNNNNEMESTKKKKEVKKKKTVKQKLTKNTAERQPNDLPVLDNGVEEKAENVDISAWDGMLVPEEVLKALKEMNFTHPTQVQQEVIKTAIQARSDVVAAAETGSGKTLAFGIPLLHHMMDDRARGFDDKPEEVDDPQLKEDEIDNTSDAEDCMESLVEEEEDVCTKVLPALILTPTRELAMQVKDHLAKAGKYTGFKMVAIVGGMSMQKQERLLNSTPDIIIATPGRLWEFINQGHSYLSNLHRIRYLVIDEADRMLEKGHFGELVKILKHINHVKHKNSKRQTYIFSATLTTVHHGPARARGKAMTKTVKLETLMKKIGIKEKRHVVDLTTKKGTAENLYEAKIVCSVSEKDLHVYYFIRSHPGRTLVFTNSIDCIFHLTGVLQALGLSPLHLHAKMQQRQRLKHLERFCASPDSVLIASDVAARGLDIPDVQHVVHYQVPRTCETYIHRSGRSARTGKEGLSLLLVSPEEMALYKRLCNSLKLEDGISNFVVDEQRLAAAKKIVKIAKEIDSISHKKKKIRVNNDWFAKAAEEMDIELDEDVLMKDPDVEETDRLIQEKKKQLKLLLKRPLFPKLYTGKYPTKSGKPSLPTTIQASAIEQVKKCVKR